MTVQPANALLLGVEKELVKTFAAVNHAKYYQLFLRKDAEYGLTLPQKKAPQLVASIKNREEGQKLLDLLLKSKAKQFADLFFVKTMEEIGFLTLEQTIQLGFTCVWLKSCQGKSKQEVVAAKIMIVIHQKVWVYADGYNQIVQEFEILWKKLEIPDPQVKQLRENLELLKPLISLPANYGATWIAKSQPSQEAYQTYQKIFSDVLTQTLPVYKDADRYIQNRIFEYQNYIFNLVNLTLRNTEREPPYFKKLFGFIVINVNKLRALHNLCRMHQVIAENSLAGRVKRQGNFFALQEIVRHINQMQETTLNFLNWSYRAAPLSENTPAVCKEFMRKYFVDYHDLRCEFFGSFVAAIEKCMNDPTFYNEPITTEQQQQFCPTFVMKVIDILKNVIGAFEKNTSYQAVDEACEKLVANQPNKVQALIKELVNICKQNLEVYKKKHAALVCAENLCPYGETITVNEVETRKEIAWFKEVLELDPTEFNLNNNSFKNQLLVYLHRVFSKNLAFLKVEKISEFETQKFLQWHVEMIRNVNKRNFSAPFLTTLNKWGGLETENMLAQSQNLQSLHATSELVSTMLLPFLKAFEQHSKSQKIEDVTDESLFLDEIEVRKIPEAEVKEKATKKGRKNRVQKPSMLSGKAPPVHKPIVTVVTSAVYQHTIGLGWDLGSYSTPMDLCGRFVVPMQRSKHEFLHALHSFQRVHQMLVHSQDPVVQRTLAVRFMHQGYLALEQCLNVISTQPKHQLSKMMLEAGVKMDCLWTQNADCGTFVARYSGYQFTNTLPMHQLVESVLKDTDKWFVDFHNLLALILEKDPKFSTIQRVREIFRKFQNVETLKESKWSEADLTQLASLNTKAGSLEKLRKQISEVSHKLRTSQNDLDQEMAKRLVSIDHHIQLLNDLIAVIKEYPGSQFMLQHAEEALLHTLYIADNLGTYLALSKRQVDFRDAFHYLGTFRDSYGLGIGLKQEQISVLDDISYIGKGSELPYSYFTRQNSEKAVSKTMIMLSDLFNKSRQLLWYGEVLKSNQKNVGTDQFWQHLHELFDLSDALVKIHVG